MVKDSRPIPCHPYARAWPAGIAIALLTIASAGAMGFWMLETGPDSPPPSTDSNRVANEETSRLFYHWPKNQKPALALVLTGQVMGYLQPCGCSSPQFGGFERRYNFIQKLTAERGWPVVSLDLGDLPQRPSPQSLIKYRYSMQAMKKIGYSAVGLGENELLLSLTDLLAEYTLNNPSPQVVGANLNQLQAVYSQMGVKPWHIAAPPEGAPRVGIIGAIGRSVTQKRGVNEPIDPLETVIPTALKEVQAKKPDILVLLLNGSSSEAIKVAKKFPQFAVILCLTLEEEPPSMPKLEGETRIIGVGHKGRYVGIVGFYPGNNGRPWDVHYFIEHLSPEYETPAGKEADNPILALYDAYAKEVKDKNYLAHYAKSAHAIQQVAKYQDAYYVGSERCKKCHEASYKVWENSPHSHAYATLEKAMRPALRQYDGECVLCHVIGFPYNKGFANEIATPKLINNGCENCHGPGSAHVKNKHDPELNKLMNPYRTLKNETPQQKMVRLNKLNDSCQKCHDTDNDVSWNIEKWVKGKIEHHEPGLRDDADQ